jgi:excisionase family DNA binding protein
MPEKYFSTPEVAKILGISRIAVFKQIKSGKLAAMKVGKGFLVEKSHVFNLYKKKLEREAKRQIKSTPEPPLAS